MAQIGDQVKLSCVANAAIAYWHLSTNGVATDEGIIVGPGCSTLNPTFADHYAMESLNGGKTCNLNVSNITMEQAGSYRCSDGSSELWSLLTVTGNSLWNSISLNFYMVGICIKLYYKRISNFGLLNIFERKII